VRNDRNSKLTDCPSAPEPKEDEGGGEEEEEEEEEDEEEANGRRSTHSAARASRSQ
jgi:hypothetical protein